MSARLPLPPPPVRLPPRPDVVAPAPPRRRPPWLVVIVAGLVAAMLVAQVGAATWFADRPDFEGEYAFIGGSVDAPYRWNPCQPIHYEVNLDHASSGALDDVHEAVRRVSEATGIEFVEDGTTSRTVDSQMGRSFRGRMPGEPHYLPVLIEWVPHRHFDELSDARRAAAFGFPYRGSGELATTYVSGAVAMDAGERVPSGFAGRYSRGVIVMHELGHVMGLAHVGSPYEIMWSPETSEITHPDLWQTTWGPGDLEGLRALGRGAGCLPPRPEN